MGSLLSLRFKQVGKAARLLCLFRVLSYLPLPVAYRLASVIGNLEARRKNSYLDAIASGMDYIKTERFSLNDRQIKKYIVRHSEMMAREMVDSYVMAHRSGRMAERLSTLSGGEIVRERLKHGKGVIILVCHYSRLNMVACSLGCSGISTGLITQCVDRRNRSLDWVDRSYLAGKLARYHKVTRGVLVSVEDNLRPIYKALCRNEAVIILIDAFNPRFRRFRTYPFLGGTIRLPVGALRIAGKTGAPMVYGVVTERGWKTEVNIRGISNSVLPEGAAMDAAVAELEKDVIRRPWEWWQWTAVPELWSSGG